MRFRQSRNIELILRIHHVDQTIGLAATHVLIRGSGHKACIKLEPIENTGLLFTGELGIADDIERMFEIGGGIFELSFSLLLICR